MKINVGAGRHILDGWCNIDVQRSPRAKRDPEIFADARNIPLPDECADEVMAIHVFEHFYYWECASVLAEWRRLLKPGGLLVLELPDLLKCCQNVVDGTTDSGKHKDQFGMWGLYGDPREADQYMAHRWGWSPGSLSSFLRENGFRAIAERPTQWHGTGRHRRDMRLEALKG